MAPGRCQRVRDRGCVLKTGLPLLVLAGTLAMPALALRQPQDPGHFDANVLRVEEGRYLGTTIADVPVTTAAGSESLLDLADGKPLILALVYYGCGHSCPVTLRHLAGLELENRGEFKIMAASFDQADTLDSMATTRQGLSSPGVNDSALENWVFGLLDENAAIRLSESVGFNYFYSEQDQVFAHPAVLVFVSPQGRITRYLYGTPESRDINLALLESKEGLPRPGDVLDMFKLSCFQFDETRSRYVLHPTVIFGGAGFGVLGLVGILAFTSRKHSLGGSR